MLLFFQKYYIFLFAPVALSVYIFQSLSLALPDVIQFYANDVLCMPIVLYSCQQVLRYVKSNRFLTINLTQQVVLTILYALYFELILPRYSDRYTGDVLDMVCYLAGCFIFYFLNHKQVEKL